MAADFINIVVWGKQAESVANYTVKGRLIGVSGRLQTRNYDAKDGTKRYVTEVVADEIQFLEWAKNSKVQASKEENSNIPEITPVDDGDIPF